MARFQLNSPGEKEFDWRTALSLALASKLAYATPAQVQTTAQGSWGFQECRFIEVDDSQCFVALASNAVVVAFRGTEMNLGDWLGNLNAFSTVRTFGRVHAGFLEAFMKVEGPLRAALSGLAGRPLLLTGHSLGGALATVAAAHWQGQLPISWVYTFGQPGVGKGDFPAFFRRHYPANFIRFVNDDDIVPRVPPTYEHVGRLFHFDAQGNLKTQQESPASTPPTTESVVGPAMLSPAEFDRLRSQLLEQNARAKERGVESPHNSMLEGFFPSLRDHSLDRYIAKIEASATS
jgi:pimeloyl-ACP methyl ester carboxylesterase